MKNLIRLDKFLSEAGFCSKKKAQEFINTNKVYLNDKLVKEPGVKLDLEEDKLRVNNKLVQNKEEKAYYLLNKPKGVVSTVLDEHKRPTVVSLIEDDKRLFPVGRLDENTSGLIIITNDGELSNKLTHPSFHTPKTYRLVIRGFVPKPAFQKLKNGVMLKDGMTKPAVVEVAGKDKDKTLLDMTIYEGKNRQIRRMCGALKLELLELKRIAIGELQDTDLKIGEYRKLTESEIALLMKETE